MRSTSFDAAVLEKCLSAAVAAPSVYNAQPWRFRLDPETVTFHVRAASHGSLRYTDPEGRALHLSVGACVLNLRIAMAHFGWEPVTRLLPSPEDPDLLASVRPTEPLTGPRGADAGLYEAIWRRHSSRFPFSDRPIPPYLRLELAAAAGAEGARLGFPDAAETARLLSLTAQAEQRNRLDADRMAESRRWVRGDPYTSSDTGLPWVALGPQDARERLPMRDFTAERHPERLAARTFETTPAIARLTTAHDRRADWLRAGQALERVLLVATARGLRASLLHQAMEWPDLRDSLSAPTEHAHMLVRLGYGPQGPATPRRAAHTLLDTGPTDT
ncbi:Acg family FMN-binding oxidoreductase [Streptomyces dysideae]|uniref:Aromatic ring-opening dioxygenase LigA n=1 Tax=Streptomyces dysideae TaxID=909626 RepID=A0A101UVR5_9ACTN|nr:nitroreductase family protein [Streptomyces dysideae]KUO17748.1 aromatic ring-opening dioxygenase LigA [Streptomyces dysideae]